MFSPKIFPFVFLLFCTWLELQGQDRWKLEGFVVDQENNPVEGVSIILNGNRVGETSDSTGYFSIMLEGEQAEIDFNHVNYQSRNITYQRSERVNLVRIEMVETINELEQVEIRGDRGNIRDQAGLTVISPREVQNFVTPFNEFNRILTTLPGVAGNNELSSAYSVRGGNFDENLVYVNDMPVYRPFLIRAGQQEGLSFVNPDLVGSIEFSAGGWQAKYGDKLSSNLNITYREPESFRGSVTAGLLGGSAHLEGIAGKRFNYLVGVRHKSSKYLLNTLETKGEYLPRFSDLQSYFNYKVGKNANATQIGMLMSYSRNRYQVVPSLRETEFGTLFSEILRFRVAFAGQELMEYDTYQGGIRIERGFGSKFNSLLIVSAVRTAEREYFDLEGGYRLCDVNKNIGNENFDQCLANRGIGSNYQFARNRLQALVGNIETRNELKLNSTNTLEFGAGYSLQDISDVIQEYSFLDSAGFVSIDEQVSASHDLVSNQFTGFVQNTTLIGQRHYLNAGIRINYFDFNQQLLVSPRLQYSYRPAEKSGIVLRTAFGLYQQPPFYREMRNRNGELVRVKAQQSLHFSSGIDQEFNIWGRPFRFTAEGYYKYLFDLNSYEIENVRIRYLANNEGEAYAFGADFRISGEFIPGAVSWFSLGLLKTRENISGDSRGYIRRPSDQWLNFAVNFEDHFPNDPSIRMNLALFLGSGLPFGPPGNLRYRNYFNGRMYRRVDIGFSKVIQIRKSESLLNSIWLGAEVLNLLGNNNIISYSWIRDNNNQQYAIPNALSARFLNIKIIANF
jgi:hypothetical protein